MRHFAVLGMMVVLAGAGLGGIQAAAPPPGEWLSAAGVQRQLHNRVPKIYWSGTPLRRALRSLSLNQRVAMLLDRRVDPDQRLEMTLQDLTLEEVLGRIVEGRVIEYVLFGPVVYVGPPEAVAKLRTLALLRHEEARRLPPAIGDRLLAVERLSWEDLATPRELLSQLAAAGGVELAGRDQVPHDLWAAGDLPLLPLVDRLTLLAIQFDLTFRVDAASGRLALVPLPAQVAIDKEYAGGEDAEQRAQQWAAVVPESEVRVEGAKILVRGRIEDHEKLTAPRTAAAPPPPRSAAVPTRPSKPLPGKARFTVNGAKGPLGRLLKELAAKLDLDLRIDEEALEKAGISVNQEVSFQVKDATAEELFRAVVAPAGCAFRIQGRVIEVYPAEPHPER